MDVALVGRALAHAGHRDLAGLADLGGQGDPDRVQQLRRDRRADRHQVVLVRAVVAGHLAAARRRVAGRRVLGGHDVARRSSRTSCTSRSSGRTARSSRGPSRTPRRSPTCAPFVALAADDERDPAGPVEDPHPLVDGAGERDHPVHREEVGVGQPDDAPRMRRRPRRRLAIAPASRPSLGSGLRVASEVDRPSVDGHRGLAEDLRQRRVGMGRQPRSPTASPRAATPRLASAMRSVACGPMMWTPSVSSVSLSAMTLTKPSYSPPMIALAIAWNGTLPILSVWPRSVACASVRPIEAISGRQ